VRSRKLERAIARTRDMGLRRDPQPPIPMVMPGRSRATTSSSVIRLSAMVAPLCRPYGPYRAFSAMMLVTSAIIKRLVGSGTGAAVGLPGQRAPGSSPNVTAVPPASADTRPGLPRGAPVPPAGCAGR
jgi:hypothetical protein